MRLKHHLLTTVSIGCLMSMCSLQLANAQDAKPKADDEELEEIVVVGIKASLKKARDIERDADTWKNVVAADDIGNFPDQNVAESLQRLPGLSIGRDEGEGRFVIVRGLSPAFNNVTVNGVRVGASGEESRDNIVSLDAVPSDLLSGIEVTKSLTPDMDGDAIAGSINLKTLSAFDRKDDSMSLRAEGSYNERAEKASPKISGSLTRLFDTSYGADTLGLALTASYSRRNIRLDDLRVARSSGNDLRSFDLGEGTYYRPEEIDQRLEIGTRVRLGGTASLDFRPDDNNRYYLNVTATRLTDDDVRVQQEWETRRASGSEVKVIGPNTGVFDDVDLEKQIFFKDTTNNVFSVGLGGENIIDNFELSYQADFSKNTYNNPLGTRGRFRERDELVFYSATNDSVIINATPDTDQYSRKKSGVDITDPSKFNFDDVLIDDVRSEDETYSGKVDGKWNLELNDQPAYIKAGVKYRSRSKFTRARQLLSSPSAYGFSQTLADVGTFDPDNTNLNNFSLIPNLDASQALFNDAEDAILADIGFNQDSSNSSFDVTEKVFASYVMGQMYLSDKLSIIAGARLENTAFDTAGTISETLRTCDNDACDTSTNTQIGEGDVIRSQNYTDILPSLHFKYEPSDELVVRLSLTQAIKRPDFDESRPNISILTEEQDDGSFERSLAGGNPNLKTLKANQIDFLVSWYPSQNLSISGGVFYKDLKNNIVEATLIGDAVAQAGYTVGNGTQAGGFDSVTTYYNGSSASVIGFELSYFQAFEAIPGIFVSGNATWSDSKTRVPLVRPDEVFDLPDQPDLVGNFSVGYENETLSFRVSGNYVGEKLESVASDAALDEIRESRFSVDLGATYKLSESTQVYFDVINLNNAKDVRVFRNGENAPRMFESVQDYGRTFQLGLRANF